jgi:hypothetical protein
MRVVFDGGKHGKPLLGHAAAVGPQGGGPCFVALQVCRRALSMPLIMNPS